MGFRSCALWSVALAAMLTGCATSDFTMRNIDTLMSQGRCNDVDYVIRGLRLPPALAAFRDAVNMEECRRQPQSAIALYRRAAQEGNIVEAYDALRRLGVASPTPLPNVLGSPVYALAYRAVDGPRMPVLVNPSAWGARSDVGAMQSTGPAAISLVPSNPTPLPRSVMLAAPPPQAIAPQQVVPRHTAPAGDGDFVWWIKLLEVMATGYAENKAAARASPPPPTIVVTPPPSVVRCTSTVDVYARLNSATVNTTCRP